MTPPLIFFALSGLGPITRLRDVDEAGLATISGALRVCYAREERDGGVRGSKLAVAGSSAGTGHMWRRHGEERDEGRGSCAALKGMRYLWASGGGVS